MTQSRVRKDSARTPADASNGRRILRRAVAQQFSRARDGTRSERVRIRGNAAFGLRSKRSASEQIRERRDSAAFVVVECINFRCSSDYFATHAIFA